MSPVTPDPSEPRRASDAVARLKLAQALRRAKYAIAWEQAWPPLARLLTVVGLFLVVSWAGLWLVLPFLARIVGVALFVLLALVAIWPLARFRWPSREQALSRLDRASGIRHRPATTLTDTLTTQDPVASALWRAQRERTLAAIKHIRAGLPSPRLSIHDPWALRALVVVLLVVTYVAAGGDRMMRLAAGFDWNGILAPANIRLDAWVDPPSYTGVPPIIMTAANRDAASSGAAPLRVPEGSKLTVRASGGRLNVVTGGGVTETAAAKAPQGTSERHYTITGDGSVRVRAPSDQPEWRFAAIPDQPPTISLAKEPKRLARGALQLSYKLHDDYGVTEAQAQIAVRPSAGQSQNARPLFKPPQFPLVLPNARTRNGIGETVKDLTKDPYAGSDVTLTLTAKDEPGHEGRSEPFKMRLPERAFTKSLPRALIEQRRILALDANKRSEVLTALDGLLIAPQLFMRGKAGEYLGLRNVTDELEAAHTDDALRQVVASLWNLAVSIEDGNLTDVDKALRAAQDALKQALDRGASDQEIRRLTQNLQAALDKYMQELAKRFQNNPLAMAPPDSNTQFLRQQDLDDLIERMERLSRSGDKEGAKQLLERLEEALENLQMARPGQPGQSGEEQALNELGDMIRKQQQLRDRTFKQGQESRRNHMHGNDQGMGQLQQDQEGLRNQLRKLQQELARRGMLPSDGAEQGQQGGQAQQGNRGQQGKQQGNQGRGGNGLGEAGKAMGDASGQLGQGNADAAVDSQGRALEALRKGAQSLADAMQRGNGQGNGTGARMGWQQGGDLTDPLGRPTRGHNFADDLSKMVPGKIDEQRARKILEELRRRLSDRSRSQLELDYIKRLLKGD